MALPQNELYSVTPISPFLSPDILIREPLTRDVEMGGVALKDPTRGLRVRDWVAELVGSQVYLYPADTPSSSTVILAEAGITELSLAFDANMEWALAYMVGGVMKLSWYDVGDLAREVITLSGGEYSPFLTFDDKRDPAVRQDQSDILWFYLKSNWLCYRQLRDKFTVERQLVQLTGTDMQIRRVGMNNGNRMQVEILNASLA